MLLLKMTEPKGFILSKRGKCYDTHITSKQMEITPAIREHVEERLAKLGKWQTQLINPHFVLNKVPNGFTVEASIGTPLGNLLASATSDDMYKAINEVEEKLERQLNKLQHKSESRRADERLKDSFRKLILKIS